jgi:hypothetical protein
MKAQFVRSLNGKLHGFCQFGFPSDNFSRNRHNTVGKSLRPYGLADSFSRRIMFRRTFTINSTKPSLDGVYPSNAYALQSGSFTSQGRRMNFSRSRVPGCKNPVFATLAASQPMASLKISAGSLHNDLKFVLERGVKKCPSVQL